MPPISRRHLFWGLPTRGGWLTIANAAFWLCFAWAAESRWLEPLPYQLVLPLFLVMSLPLSCFCLLTQGTGFHDRVTDVVMSCMMVGVNSFIWGYGVSGLFANVGRWPASRAQRRLRRGLCPQCQYDLRATPMRCPECGWVRP